MATNLNIDINLLEKAYQLGGMNTKRETVNFALKEFIQRRKQKDILKLIQKIQYEDSYNYKKARSRTKQG